MKLPGLKSSVICRGERTLLRAAHAAPHPRKSRAVSAACAAVAERGVRPGGGCRGGARPDLAPPSAGLRPFGLAQPIAEPAEQIVAMAAAAAFDWPSELVVERSRGIALPDAGAACRDKCGHLPGHASQPRGARGGTD